MINWNIFTAAMSFLLVVAVSFGLLTLLSSFIRFHLLADRLEKATADENVDPKDIFRVRVIRELGAFHQKPSPFTLFLLTPFVPPDFEHTHGAEALAAAREYILDALKKCLRDKDTVVPVDTLYGVLVSIPYEQGVKVAERVSKSMAETAIKLQDGSQVRWPFNVGVVSFPEHGERTDDLLSELQKALAEARARGPGHMHVAPAPQEASSDTNESASVPVGLLDPLTGVLRADRFSTALQKKFAQRIRFDRGVCVLHLSIDHFAQYQDHYGASATDTLLKGIADILSKYTRETDILARTDDHEFAIVMDCAPEMGLLAAQRIVQVIKRTPFRVQNASLKATVSMGVAGYPTHANRAKEAWSYAQAAMTAAREHGSSVALLYQAPMQERLMKRKPVDVF